MKYVCIIYTASAVTKYKKESKAFGRAIQDEWWFCGVLLLYLPSMVP